MRNLLLLILRFKDNIVFLLLAFFSLYLTVNFNHLNRVNWLHASNAVGGNIQNKTSNVIGYFNLKEKNSVLAESNAKLLSDIIHLKELQRKVQDSLFSLHSLIAKDTSFTIDSNIIFHNIISKIDTTELFIPTDIVYNTTTNNFNYLSIDKGELDGIRLGNGLITERGIIGKVISTSNHFSLVKSILHRNNKISAKIKGSNELGSLIWEHKNINTLSLKDIPRHEKITIGDTVVTTEYNSVYPKNHPIGTIISVNLEKDEPFYKCGLCSLE